MRGSRIIILAMVAIVCLPGTTFALFLGPYTGKVIDSQTQKPIDGASVLFYWKKRVPMLPTGGSSEPAEVKFLYTNKEGAYQIPRFSVNLGLLGLLESTHIIIYQPGYEAYIVTIWRDDSFESKAETSFREKDNLVRLSRIPPNFDHKKHYEMIGVVLEGLRDDLGNSFHEKEGPISWNKLWEIRRKSLVEKGEFLRRVEWERKRGLSEDKR